MISRVKHSIKKNLVKWGVLPPGKSKGVEANILQYLEKELSQVPRFTPGQISVAGWDLFYNDAAALKTCFRTLIVNRWNDFTFHGDDPVILDCGANIGVSVLRYKQLFPNAQITAFEPDREICNLLRKNLAANNVTDVKVVEAAVWTENGEQAFFVEGADGGRLIGGEYVFPATTSRVKTIRFADYLKNNKVDFIKMDIEGAETAVIKDCVQYLHDIPMMVVEYHYMKDNPQALASVISDLASAGFYLALNSYGTWVDLMHIDLAETNIEKGYDQYFLICAWRDSA